MTASPFGAGRAHAPAASPSLQSAPSPATASTVSPTMTPASSVALSLPHGPSHDRSLPSISSFTNAHHAHTPSRSPAPQASPTSVQASPAGWLPGPASAASIASPVSAAAHTDAAAATTATASKGLRVRASIACQRCRSSKIKCNNMGEKTVCDACKNKKLDCVYTTSGPPEEQPDRSQRRRHSEVPNSGEVPAKKRQRRPLAMAGSVAQPAKERLSAEDPLSSPLLTTEVWKELFAIFQRHFRADLPFLDEANFDINEMQKSSPPMPQYPRSFLLAFLTLTAKFHEGLVAYHRPTEYKARPSLARLAPLVTADYYSAKFVNQLEIDTRNGIDKSFEHTQALLMHCLHEWCGGAAQNAWQTLSLAWGSAKFQKLHAERDAPHTPSVPENVLRLEFSMTDMIKQSRKSVPKVPSPTEKEIRRRVLWSCFLMESSLASGKCEMPQFQVEHITTPLPQSDDAFALRRNAPTLTLTQALQFGEHQTDDETARQALTRLELLPGKLPNDKQPNKRQLAWLDSLEVGDTEGPLSCYIRAQHLFGEVLQWSCKGGRRIEHNAPWEPTSGFNKLQTKMERFAARLPENLRLSDEMTSVHMRRDSGTHYLLIHLSLLLDHIMLHREYIPFTPFQCSKPEGPLDAPTFSKEQVDAYDPDYWIKSAETLFKAARDLITLIRAAQQRDRFVETPLTAFALYQIGVVAVYRLHFPQIDTQNYIDKSALDFAKRGLFDISARLKMAVWWYSTIDKLDMYFKSKRATPGAGGNLEDYKSLEGLLKPMAVYEGKMHIEALSDAISKGMSDLEKACEQNQNLEQSSVKSRSPPPPPSPTTSASTAPVSTPRSTSNYSQSRMNTFTAVNNPPPKVEVDSRAETPTTSTRFPERMEVPHQPYVQQVPLHSPQAPVGTWSSHPTHAQYQYQHYDYQQNHMLASQQPPLMETIVDYHAYDMDPQICFETGSDAQYFSSGATAHTGPNSWAGHLNNQSPCDQSYPASLAS